MKGQVGPTTAIAILMAMQRLAKRYRSVMISEQADNCAHNLVQIVV